MSVNTKEPTICINPNQTPDVTPSARQQNATWFRGVLLRVQQPPIKAAQRLTDRRRVQEHGGIAHLASSHARRKRNDRLGVLSLAALAALSGSIAQDHHEIVRPSGCWRMSIDGANTKDASDPTRATNSTMAIKRALPRIYTTLNGTDKSFILGLYSGITTTGRELDEKLSVDRAPGEKTRLADIISFCIDPNTYSVSIGPEVQAVERKLTMADEPVIPTQTGPGDTFLPR